jgi:hypothetical protein
MAISSASTRIFKADDPVMTTDLELLAKVDGYKEEQFQEGEKDLQSEINNWSLLRNVAKPQDHQYINEKLTGLLSKVNSLGSSFDLSNPANVNTLKNLGYSLYADKSIMNAVSTTRRMQALQQDVYNKTNGKNAKNYDSVYGEYLQNQYSDWLNDGKQGTSFDGPTALPQGNFDQYQKKLQDGLAKLTPDLNEAPQGTADALNYYQVGDKFIKKERVDAYIDANTSEQDRSILNAHAWKGFQGYSDNSLLTLQNRGYDSKISSLQDTWNTLQNQRALSKGDWKQTELYTQQMDDVANAIESIKGQKNGLPQLQDGQALPKQYREQLQSSLFNTAFKDNMSNAWAFDQKKVDLKTNTAKIDMLKMSQQDYQFGKMYALHEREANLKDKEYALHKDERMMGFGGLNGPAGTAPLSLITTPGGDPSTILNDNVAQKADANYIKTATDFNTLSYNYLMTKDPNVYGRYVVKDGDGNYVPKDESSAKYLRGAIGQALDKFGNIANMSIKERDGLTLNEDDQAFFDSSKKLKEAQLYKEQMQGVTDQVFRNAGKQSPYQRPISIKLKNGSVINTLPESEGGGPLTYAALKQMIDRKDPLLDTWKKEAKDDSYDDNSKKKEEELKAAGKRIFTGGFFGVTSAQRAEYNKVKADLDKKYPDEGMLRHLGQTLHLTSTNSVDNAISSVNSYYDDGDVKKAWQDASKTFNVFGATPNLTYAKDKSGKLNSQYADYLAGQVRDQHKDLAPDVKDSDMDILKVYPIFDPESKNENPVKYLADVKYRSGAGEKKGSGDKITTIDLTNVVNQQQSNGGGFFSNLYPTDNAEIVYGMLLNNKGQTPLDPKDNYTTALQTHSNGLLTHKYQIVSVKNPSTNGVDGYRVNLLVPKGKDKNGVAQFQTVPVKNFYPTALGAGGPSYNFPANFKYVTKYMDGAFVNSDRARSFYELNGIPYNQ